MPPVFGRDVPNPHPYDGALAEWLATAAAEYCALARNVMHDHRVSDARERAFDAVVHRPVTGPITGSALQDAISDYFKEKVRTRRLPHYVYQAINGHNIIYRAASPDRVIHPDLRLVRLLDINGLWRVFVWARDRDDSIFSIFADFPEAPTDPSVADWLDQKLLGRPETIVADFVAQVLDVMNGYRLEQPFQPTWATTWAALQPHLSKPPERWLEVLGMYRARAPRWVILLKYPVRDAGTLARPTQLSCEWYPFHFPSPPQAPLSVGGHPMHLNPPLHATQLLPEYIHKQIGHPLEHWLNAGRHCRRTEHPTPAELSTARNRHLELLERIYGPGVRRWMPACL